MPKKTILFFINTLDVGGAEITLLDLLACLPRSEYDLTVVTVSGGLLLDKCPKDIRYKQLINIPCKTLRKFFSKLLYRLSPAFVAKLLGKPHDIEIAYLEGFPTRVIAKRKTRHNKIFAFVHLNFSKTSFFSHLYKDKAACLQEYSQFNNVCFVSEGARQGFSQTIGALENALVVHNVIRYDRLRNAAQGAAPKAYSTHGLKLISVGRLSPEKAFDRLIRSVARLEQAFPLELLILGDGPLRSELETLIAELGTTSVHLLGYQSNPYIYLKQADLYVCSSFSEGCSLAIREAVSLGVPLITTECGSAEEIRKESWGIVVLNDEESLYEGLYDLLTDTAKYNALKQAAYEKSHTITNETAIREYTQLFESQ